LCVKQNSVVADQTPETSTWRD